MFEYVLVSDVMVGALGGAESGNYMHMYVFIMVLYLNINLIFTAFF